MARRRARRTDTGAASRGPRQVTLLAELYTRPGDDLGTLLALSTELVDSLNAWNERYEAAPREPGDVWVGADEWLNEGVELARLVQLEADQAGEDVQVIYYHDRSRNPQRGSGSKELPHI